MNDVVNGTGARRHVLVVLGHPDSSSYCAALADAYAAGLDADRYEVEVLRLGELDFDPVLRFGYRKRMPADPVIERSQELVTWADHIVLVFPVWWSQMPGLLKGWVDRVFVAGFGYKMNGLRAVKLLRGRTATLVLTAQEPALLIGSTVRLVRRHVLGLCGIKTTQVRTCGLMTTSRDTPERRERFLSKVGAAAARLDVKTPRQQ
ncbi:MAG: NAD(P)H-dependent oxidoreductase [Micrococcales bacterium]|nr:NAD(P)H-dependent oxidoreductase [Micrococcales bacterium]MCL2668961.1 NAD(P)H-dependent oxidoreductase [Micrococcales bacterium]